MSSKDKATAETTEQASMWNVLAQVGGMLPGVEAVSRQWAGSKVTKLLGFWLMWHMLGGLRGLIDLGAYTTSSAYRIRGEFVEVFGLDVEEFWPQFAAVVREAAKRDDQ